MNNTVKTIGCVALVVAAMGWGGSAAAGERDVETRSTRVSYADLDINTEAGARAVLSRIENAARRVCRPQSLTLPSDVAACRREAVRKGVKDLNAPIVTAMLERKNPSTQLASR